MVFDVSHQAERTLTVIEWVLVAAFGAEVLIQGALARDRRAWLRSPWRIVDAITVLGPVAALLPQVSDFASSSLMLRMLRVGRAVAFGTRAGSAVVRKERRPGPANAGTTPTVTLVSAEGNPKPVESDWKTFLAWTQTPGASWFHASNVNQQRFSELARAAGVSDQEVNAVVSEDGHAKLRQDARSATLVLQIPTVADNGFPEVHRDRLLCVVTDRGLVTAMKGWLK